MAAPSNYAAMLDNGFALDAQQHEYPRYLEHDIALHEYQCHFNHLKLAVFDERWSIHGSVGRAGR